MRLLIDRADIRVFSSKRTALHLAAMQGHAGIVDLLLKNGSEMDILDADGHTPLELAIGRRSFDVILLLRGKGAAASFEEAIAKHGDEWMKLLQGERNTSARGPVLSWDADYKVRRRKSRHDPLLGSWGQYQVAKNNPAITYTVLEQKQKALMACTIENNCPTIVRALLKDGWDANAFLDRRDHASLNPGDPWIMSLLMKHGPATAGEMSRMSHTTLLHFAARADSEEVMEVLLDAGAAVNFQNFRGETALHRAVDARKYSNVEFLVQKGGDINIKDVCDRTALH